MKKILYIIASAAVLFSACEKEQNILPALEGQNDLVTQSFTVSAPNTKTSLDGLEVIWSEGDEINVIEVDSQGNFIAERDFTLDSGAGSSSAVFVGEVASSDNTFYAIYPNVKLYEQPTIVNDETIVDIKKPNNDQTAEAVENGFDSSLAFMTAICDNNSFTFRHAVAFLKFIVKNDDIKSIRITVGGGARIFGRPSIVLGSGEPSAVNGSSGSTNFITVSPKSGSFVEGSFYLVPITIKPNNSLGTVTLTATDQNGTNSILSATLNSLKPEAGIVYNIGTPVFDFSTDPVLTVNKTSTQVEAEAATGLTITGAYTLKNCSDNDVTVTYDGTVVTTASVAGGTVTFSVSENSGEARDGWIGLNLSGEEPQMITVKQKKPATSAGTEYVWNFTSDYKADINVSDTQTYKYTAGAVSAVTSWTEKNVLYFSPNGKALKSQSKTSTSDKIKYHPISYAGGAAYLFFNTDKSGTLFVTATVGKTVDETGNCKLGVRIAGAACGNDVDLTCYNPAADGLAAEEYSWAISNTSGVSQEIQIIKPSGNNSPWIFEVKFVED